MGFIALLKPISPTVLQVPETRVLGTYSATALERSRSYYTYFLNLTL